MKKTRLFFFNFIFVIFLVQLALQPCLYASENRGVYDVAGQQYLRSLQVLVPNKKSLSADDKTKVSLKKIFMKDQEKLTILLQQLSDNDSQVAVDSVTEDLLMDLNVFYGHSSDPSCSLHKIMDRTTTVFGKAGLVNMLAQPSANIDQLHSRQMLIKKMVKDTDFFITVHNVLQKVRAAEDGFFSYWQKEDSEVTKLVNKVYWNNRLPNMLNKSAIALEVGTRLNNLVTGLKLSFPAILMAVSDCGQQYTMTKKIDVGQVLKNTSEGVISFFSPKPIYDDYKMIRSGEKYKKISNEYSMYGLDCPYSEAEFKKISYIGLGIWAIIKTLMIGGYVYSAKTTLSEAGENQNIINYLHTRLIDVATITSIIKEIGELAGNYKEVFHGLLSLSCAYDLFDANSIKSAECKTVIELLQTNTFKDKASFFSRSGRVLAAHTLFKQVKNEFIKALQVIGELDACFSIAKIYKESQHRKVSYSFVEYKKGKTPYIQLKEFWNPFVDTDKVVTNTIILDGATLPRGVVLTGSNTGGKSTLLKAIFINLLLAQTCGIVAAKKAVIVPCDYIVSSLNISDNTAAGISLFQSEVNRAKSIAQIVEQSAVDNKLVFVGIDELFTGTSANKGKQAAIEFVQKLLTKNNCSFMFATHFSSVTDLEKMSSGICKNMKMEAFAQADGSIIRPFKLEDGISTHNIANAILAQQLNGVVGR